MKTVINPEKSSWTALCTRPSMDNQYLRSTIRNILDGVKKGGDQALKDFTKRFDQTDIANLEVSPENLAKTRNLEPKLKAAIETAAKNIRKFHELQLVDAKRVETFPGVVCWRKPVAIDRVGLYIPGGTAPLFSTVLMLAIPAKLAGCNEIVLCTPPDKNGEINPAILYAAQLTGVNKIFRVGGAQAIAAMSFGTESIPATDKIFGPGNQFVTTAKQLINEEGTAIDMPAGPSELLVLCDESANPAYIASDLLSQAEHGPDSQVILVGTSKKLLQEVNEEIEKQLTDLPRKEIALAALEYSKFIFFNEQNDAVEFSNFYAPEHLIIQMKKAESIAEEIRNAGSVFLGPYTPESAGDYASGTNHTLPTNGYAKAYSGLSVESFQKYITFQQISREGLERLGPTIEIMAENEQLEGHRRAVRVRNEGNGERSKI